MVVPPTPSWTKDPEPLMSFATVELLVRPKLSVALFVTAPEPREPVVPLPIWSVPAVMVVLPV